MAKRSKNKPDLAVGFIFKITRRKDKRGQFYYVRNEDGKRMTRTAYESYRKAVKDYKQVYNFKTNKQAEQNLLKSEREEFKKYDKKFKTEIATVVNQGIYTLLNNLISGINQFKQKFKLEVYYTRYISATINEIEKAVEDVLKIFYNLIRENKDVSPYIIWSTFRKNKNTAILDLNNCYAVGTPTDFFDNIIKSFKNQGLI